MPVSIVICCDAVNWVACVLSEGVTPGELLEAKYSEGSKAGRRPPSRERETWIFVSAVMREIDALRMGGDVEPIVSEVRWEQ
jgi:hypothetical protein